MLGILGAGAPPCNLFNFAVITSYSIHYTKLYDLGIPVTVLDAARAALLLTTHYPEIDGASLVRALADHHALPPENLLAGSGSTELIFV